MKSIWNGTLGFGLVNIPIKMYSASEDRQIDLDMLDSSDHSRIRYQRVNEKTGKEVEWKDIVKGYKMDEKYIVLDDEDFEQANAKKSKVIEIESFVDESEVSDLLFKKPYYLEPQKEEGKAYNLLKEALKKTKKLGLATFVMRQKENLSLIGVYQDVLVLHVIRFENEVRDPKELKITASKVTKKELDMAKSLIEQYTEKFDLASYRDVYNDQLMKVIKAKAKGKKSVVKKFEPEHTPAKDLMAQLKASLEKRKKSLLMALEEYNKKRDFKTTNEPKGTKAKQSSQPKFVVQRHQARRLHFDLRLEIDGVLKSWAVPKGPSLNPEDKRLAIQTEDHPMKYLTFEGIIPKGNYGAGEMRIWDHGTFSAVPEDGDLLEMLKKGDLKLNFSGNKLKGNFALVRTNYKSQKTNWLLIKKSDEFAIDLEYDANRHVDAPILSPGRKPKSTALDELIQPMLATNNPQLKFPTSGIWIYEIKWDGYRILTNFDGKTVNLYSRNGISYSSKFPQIVKSLRQLEKSAILDGELVALDKTGKPQFQWLQHYQENPRGDLVYMVFDLLFLDGHSIVHFPLNQRRELLEVLVEELPQIRLSQKIESSGKAFFKEAQQLGLEGIVAKKADSLYFPGIRSEDWLKFKTRNSVDALICGYTVSEKRPFGSLILGLLEEKGLRYIGNCGTGFSTKDQKELIRKFKPLIRKTSPFETTISLAGRKPVWLKPQLAAEVFFAEWTSQRLLRQPAFKGLKTEAAPLQAVKNEAPKTKSTSGSGGTLEIDGINVPVSNLEKELWPDEGITKYDLIEYYLNVAPAILPFLIDRPQNLHRHPNGIFESSFYQKDTPETYPDWIETTPVHSESSSKTIDYLLCQNEATLIYLANLACIELNPWNSRLGSLDKPDYLVIDLDPSPKNSFLEVIEVAQAFHELLKKLALESFCKTSGSSGLHIYLPMGAKYNYEEVREFCKILCTVIQHQMPSLTTMERSLKSRKGRIYLDYLQNRSGQTLASVYCVRPKPGAPVSTPLLWKEVNEDLDKEAFNIFTTEERIKAYPTLFKEVLGKGIDIEKALVKLEEV